MQRNAAAIGLMLVLASVACMSQADDKPSTGTTPAKPAEATEPVALRGRVVWMAEAMKRLHGIASDDDTEHDSVALETADGKLYPIIKETRGRAFHKDPQLLKYDYELLVRTFPGTQSVQIIRMFTLHDGK